MKERKCYEENPMAFLANPDNTMHCEVCPYNEHVREENRSLPYAAWRRFRAAAKNFSKYRK